MKNNITGTCSIIILGFFLFSSGLSNLFATNYEDPHRTIQIEGTLTSENQNAVLKQYGVKILTRENTRITAETTPRILYILTEYYGMWLKMIETEDIGANQQKFHTYDEIVTLLQKMEKDNPSLAVYDSIGKSIDGKPIVRITLTNSATNRTVAAKPRHSITGATHGNEKIGTEVALSIAEELIKGAQGNDKVKKIMDGAEVSIVPVLNVDGHIRHDRWNKAMRDPNRENGWQVGYYTGAEVQMMHGAVAYPFIDPENKAYRDAMIDKPWLTCLDFHTGIVVMLMPWFADVKQIVPDDPEMKTIGTLYTDQFKMKICNGPKDAPGPVVRDGCPGVQTDYPYGRSGTLSYCPEISNSQAATPPSNLDQTVDQNVKGYIDFAAESLRGLSGKVISKDSSKHLFARVIADKGFHVYSDPNTGVFHKYLRSAQGSHQVSIFANGYKPYSQTIYAERSNGFNHTDYILEKDPKSPYNAMSIEYIRCSNRPSMTLLHACLGPKDGKAVEIQSLEKESFILLGFGKNTPITDHKDTKDLKVVCTNNGEYTVYADNDIDALEKPQKKLGQGTGTTEFDLADANISSAQYIKIVVNKSSPAIDAIEALPIKQATELVTMSHLKENSSSFSIIQSPQGAHIQATIPKGNYVLSAYNLQGKCLQTIARGHADRQRKLHVTWSLKENLSIGNNVIVFQFKTSQGSITHKNVFTKR